MKIKTKVISGFIVVILLFITLLSVTFLNAQKADQAYSDLVNRRAVILSETINVQYYITQQGVAVRHYILTNDQVALETFNQSATRVTETLSKLETMVDTEEHRNLIAAAIEEHRPFCDISLKIIEYSTQYGVYNIPQEYLTELAQVSRAIRASIQTIIDTQEQLLKEISAQTSQQMGNIALMTIISAALVGLVIFAMGYLYLSRSIIKPLALMSERTEKIANLELDVKAFNPKGNDEIAQLGRAFSKMKDNLLDMVRQIHTSAEQVSISSHHLSIGAKQTKESAEQVANAMNEIAAGTSKQSDYAHEVLHMAQITDQTVQAGIEQAARTLSTSKQSTQTAYEGEGAIQSALEHLKEITATVEEAAAAMQNLGRRSEEIGGIITTITTIAEQTNLLALNAAIEAARAGEQGRGFAIVAEEVRKLAEESSASAQQITELIKNIQSETNSTVEKMEDSAQSVQHQVVLIGQGRESLKSIVDQAQKTEEHNTELNRIFTTLRENSVQTVKAIQEISSIIEQTSASSQEVTAAAEEQAATVDEISTRSMELDRLAEHLKEQVNRFKV